MDKDEIDIRRKICVTNLKSDTSIEKIKKAFSMAGKVQSLNYQKNMNSYVIIFEHPPDFRLLIKDRPTLNGQQVYIRPFKDKKRTIYAIPVSEQYEFLPEAIETFNSENEVDWIFPGTNGKPFEILFSSEENVQKWYNKKSDVAGKYMLLLPSDYKERRATKASNLCTIEIKKLKAETQASTVKEFLLSFGKFKRYKSTKIGRYQKVTATFEDKNDAKKCIQNADNIKIDGVLPACSIVAAPVKIETYQQKVPSLIIEKPKVKFTSLTNVKDYLKTILEKKHVFGDLYDLFFEIYEENSAKLDKSNDLFHDICSLIGSDFEECFNEVMTYASNQEEFKAICDDLYESLK